MDHLRRAFRDIAVGYSHGVLLSRPGYVKHLSYGDQINLDSRRDDFFNEAKRGGIPTNEERIVEMRAQGLWDNAKDQAILNIKQMIDGALEGKKVHMKMPSAVAKHNERLKIYEKEMAEKMTEKYSLMGLTCESYADHEVNDYFIFTNLFKDKGLTQPLFSENEFEYLTGRDVDQLVLDYNTIMEGCSTQNIRKLAMQMFFQEFYGLIGEGNTSQFFGVPICHMTFMQVKLLSHGAHFRNIYTNHDVSKFPKNVMEDPDLLTDYAVAAAKGREEMQKQGAYEEGAIVVGGKKEDNAVLGIKPQGNMVADIMKNGGNFMEWASKNAR